MLKSLLFMCGVPFQSIKPKLSSRARHRLKSCVRPSLPKSNGSESNFSIGTLEPDTPKNLWKARTSPLSEDGSVLKGTGVLSPACWLLEGNTSCLCSLFPRIFFPVSFASGFMCSRLPFTRRGLLWGKYLMIHRPELSPPSQQC
uniref:Uncharacterized protein n=1 Tax=Molossus molossus TaxID=27622 RepID=A0A7J8J0K4_MOLMO|nr:hypothetical protein HJG59_010267 [Molossus molossus]